MAQANAEQLLAIEHEGGVLLKAGAGSGKTFVLVEHIVYLTRRWMGEFASAPAGNFEDFIRERFSRVVMMTFTKKAAGEMNIRLTEKFQQLLEKASSDRELWQVAVDALPLLTVSTIDGFCRRLITNGYFPHLSTESEIIFGTERLEQVKLLFNRWFESTELAPEIEAIVIREKAALLDAFCSIFSDPGLRLEWKRARLQDTHPDALPGLLKRSFSLNQLHDSLAAINALDLPAEKERSAFERTIAGVQATGLPPVDSPDVLKMYAATLLSKRLDPERTKSKQDEAHRLAYEGLRALRDWVADWHEDLGEYVEHYERKVAPWVECCLSLFSFIDAHLDPNQGMTFGDIEYLVALGLENPEDRRRIQQDFRYLIVDEFQDTSAVQFLIIRQLIGDDFGRLFCVGDAKQAIYGFRGGELSVFENCGSLVPRVLSLANNYRSHPLVIRTNNALFGHVLPLGMNFTGRDAFSVRAEDQAVPPGVEYSSPGCVEVLVQRLEREADEKKKLNIEAVNRLEAQVLADSIESERSGFPQATCTVLYRKLGPSGDLIRRLLAKGIGFTAQFKVAPADDPVLGIFLLLLRRTFDSSARTRDASPRFLLERYLEILQLPLAPELDLARFDQEVRYWGLFEAYKKFLFRLGVTNENYDLNLQLVESLCRLHHQDPESVLVELSGDADNVSLEFRSGEAAEKVQIMTAHSSKGLEFDTVYLGGIYSNGHEPGERNMFGKTPGSFYWYLDLDGRDRKKSPFYVHESELNSFKTFSESKRLFYVACTRAKHKLLWVSLDGIEDCASIPKRSWIHGLNSWLDSAGALVSELTFRQLGTLKTRELLSEKVAPALPLFFYDNMGVHPRRQQGIELALTAELSVTRLNSLVDCPRKFYLQNVLKLLPTTEADFGRAAAEEGDEVIVSSAKRGTQIHEWIAEGIGRNFTVPLAATQAGQAGAVGWALEQLRPWQGRAEFRAEVPLKFRLFNFMVSGIPDLLLLPKDGASAEIWDFKTGRITQDKLAHYWTQLRAYAFALWVLRLVPTSDSIESKLCFVDAQEILSQTLHWKDVEAQLFAVWSAQNEPWKINSDHCAQCSYGDICPR